MKQIHKAHFFFYFSFSADVSKREMEAVTQMREAVQMVEAASLEKEQVTTLPFSEEELFCEWKLLHTCACMA